MDDAKLSNYRGPYTDVFNAGVGCQPIFYVKEEHDAFFKVLEKFDCVVVRINPGQITAAGATRTSLTRT